MTNPAKLPMTWRSLRNLFSRPATRLYPQTTRPPFEGARGQLELDIEACNYCGLCARRCPTVALCVTRDEGKVELDDMRCISCGICVEVCTRNAMGMTTKAPQVFAACLAGPGEARVGCREWCGQPPAAKTAKPAAGTAPAAAPGPPE